MNASPLALWVGPEPTVNRVGNGYFDQLELSGFAQRLDDLDRLASLGAERLRFPLLWERIAPVSVDDADWTWADTRMARLRQLALAPIVGLLHHGSGPRHTSLLDRALPDKLARYAQAVAERYPWVDAWTPVNEPLTTARFSGLYGHWFPHAHDDVSFVRALLQQVHATAAAMRAIRRINPQAMLVQTEDMGHTSSTPLLAYQAQFENERRWLSYDLLHGRVDRRHPLWDYLRRHGAREDELLALADDPCPPDIIGLNAYITSERFLDEHVERYPEQMRGGNGRDRYADVESVRVCGTLIGSFEARLREAHQRYRTPLAITEAHLGCTREEQMRWLRDAWQAAQRIRDEGADVRAVTVWAAFGSTDWNTLVTQQNGHYEPGLWDIRAPEPRPTALVTLARELAAGDPPSHPLLAQPGWWRRRDRHFYPVHGEVEGEPFDPHGRPPLLITGATGTLGRAFARMCVVRGIPYRLLRRQELDIGDPASIDAALSRWQPWAVINTAGFVRVDDAEGAEQGQRCWRENALGADLLARACGAAGIPLVTFSSDLVFDGAKDAPYVERDRPRPLNAYGRAKAAGEEAALRHCAKALVIRTAAFFGPWDHQNFATLALQAIRAGRRFAAAADQRVTPTYVPHLVEATLDLLIDGTTGLLHLANRVDGGSGALSWAEFGRQLARAAGLDPARIDARPGAALGQQAPRPHHAGLCSERMWTMPSLDRAIADYLRDLAPDVEAPRSVDHGLSVRGEAGRAVEAT